VSPSGRSAKQTVFETLRTRSLGGATRWQPGSAAIENRDVGAWAAQIGIVLSRA
jgi:hypothetical protein